MTDSWMVVTHRVRCDEDPTHGDLVSEEFASYLLRHCHGRWRVGQSGACLIGEAEPATLRADVATATDWARPAATELPAATLLVDMASPRGIRSYPIPIGGLGP